MAGIPLFFKLIGQDSGGQGSLLKSLLPQQILSSPLCEDPLDEL
jgi:hypothetical protein